MFTVNQGAANGHQHNIKSFKLSADNTVLVTCSYDKKIYHNLTMYWIKSNAGIKFITDIDNKNKTVSVFQVNFIEEIVNTLSLEQIQQAVYAQQHNQDYPKIVITPAAQALGVNIEFKESTENLLQKAAKFAKEHKTAIALASAVATTGAVLYVGPTAIYQVAKDKFKNWFNK